MLRKENRLRQDKDFQKLFEKGQGVFGPFCGIRFQKNNLAVSRFAVVAGIKVSKNAVKRNQLRRQYREILRLNLDKIKAGYDVVLLISARSLNIKFQDKEIALMKVLKKAKLLK